MQETQEMWVPSLGQEDPLEESMATHSSILAWRVPMDRGAWRATVHRVTQSWTGLKRRGMHTTFLLKCFRCLPAALEEDAHQDRMPQGFPWWFSG